MGRRACVVGVVVSREMSLCCGVLVSREMSLCCGGTGE